MESKKAFTLTELLVVVLIIVIWAAVAVPQYQKAVMKSRFATIKDIVTALAQAQEIYYLANNSYADAYDKLDISMPGNFKTKEEYPRCGGAEWGKCCLEENFVYCTTTDLLGYYRVYQYPPAGSSKPYAGMWECLVYVDDKQHSKQAQICQEETGQAPQQEFNYIYLK